MDDGLDPRLLVGVERRARIADVDRRAPSSSGDRTSRRRWAASTCGSGGPPRSVDVPLIVVHPRRTGLDDRATWKFDYRPGEGPETLRRLAEGEGDFADARRALEGGAVALLGRAGYTDDPLLAEAVAAFVLGLEGSKVLPLVRRANTFGALDMGLAPGLLPGRLEASSPAAAELATAMGVRTRRYRERLRRHPRWTARADHACSAPGGCRPGARCGPWPARRRGAGGRRVRGGARPVPHRLLAPRRRGPPRRGVRREGRDGDEPRRPGATGQQGGVRSRSDPFRLVGARRPRSDGWGHLSGSARRRGSPRR